MRVLFVGNSQEDEDIYRNFLSSIAEPDSVYFVYSYGEATDFINNRIEKFQEQLDLIILQEDNHSFWEEGFKAFIEKDTLRTYSKRDFNLVKIPIILVLNQKQNKTFYQRRNYADVIYDIGADKFFNYRQELVRSIRSWRRSVLDELDNLGIEFNSGIVNYTAYLQRAAKGIKVRDTKILSSNFQLFPRKLQYYWLEDNKRQIEQAIDEFAKMLKGMTSSSRKEEKTIHKFFNRNPFFLQRDRYSRSWYETKLKYDERKHYDPDYTLRPNFNYKTDLSVLEVKLPTERFMKAKHFHKPLKFFDHLTQVNDYKDYLEDQSNKVAINDNFGYVPKKIDYNLLIGRTNDREENQECLNKRIRQFNQHHINLVTYDDLMDYQVKFLYRMRMLHFL